jgi:RHS repeat-associated protein
MKTLRFLILGLLTMATTCGAQQFTDSGWYRAAQLSDMAAPPDPSAGPKAQALISSEGMTANYVGVPTAPVAEVITPEIQALANGLQNDPVKIFNYVHDHIRYVLYFGAKKGAQLTLLEKSGNDFDQSALLVALLRAAGNTNSQGSDKGVGYQFGWELLPYDATNHQDLHHLLGLSLINTNWSNTTLYLYNLFYVERHYPTIYYSTSDTNTFWFQRVWVTLTLGSTNYYLDPAFKVSEPITGINLSSAMGFSSNSVMSAAAGTDTANSVSGLSESALRNTLTGYATNLLGYLQNNYPNTSVQQILGGQYIVPSTNTTLATGLLFPYYQWNQAGAVMPVVNWQNEPTNLMSQLTITFAGTNHQWFFPQLEGQRASLTFDTSGTAQLWQDDTMLASHSTSGSSGTTNVVLYINHPFGTWNFTNNVLIDNGTGDQVTTNSYQRTNSTYAILYAFEPDWGWLQERQNQLDNYRLQGLGDTSRQVVSETLNVMGLNWMLQTESAEQLLAHQMGILPQWHHRVGRMAQEIGKGYYVDVYAETSGELSDGGTDAASQDREDREFDLFGLFGSALEHGIIEQLQNTNLVGASTVKMLELASTNAQTIYLASSANWTSGANVSGSVANYDSTTKTTIGNLTANGYYILLPQNGSNHVAAAGSWAGYGYWAELNNATNQNSILAISGGYHGGYDSDPNATVNTPVVVQDGDSQPTTFANTPTATPNPTGADPVDMADGTFQLEHTDLSLGQSEPRGVSLSRYYNGTRRFSNPAGMAGGWIHNYSISANTVAAPQAGFGGTTPAQAAPMFVATCAAIGVFNDLQPDAKNWMVSALIAKWGIDQLTKNGASVTLGKDTVQFVKQPNGVFTPPANTAMTLTQNGSSYSLQERHGNTFNFNSAGLLTNIVDQYNQSLALTYNASNLVSTVTDWKSRSLTFTYSGSQLTSVADSAGRSVSYGYSTTYNTQGDLTSFTDPEGKTSTYAYDTNHEITATINEASQLVASNLYDGFGHLNVQYTQGDTNKTWHIFWSGWQTIEQDPTGSQRIFSYDDAGRLISLKDQLGNFTQTFYDGQNHIVTTVSPLGETNQFIYDGNNNLTNSIDPLGFSKQSIYDNQNNLTRTIDARGIASTFGYNTQFSLIGSTNGAGDFVNYSYNTDGTLASRVDSGGTTTFGYDSYGQLNSVTYPSSLGSESFVKNTLGDVTSHTDGRGFSTTFQYNLRRQLTNSVAPTNLITKIAYDAVGNAAAVTDARGNTSSNSWSATRNLAKMILPATSQGVPIVTNIYDNRDWLVGTHDPLQNTTQYTNDVAGRLIATTDPLLRTTALGYDADGHKITSTNAAGEITKQNWDARGKLIQLTDGAGHTVLSAYDGAGNQITLTNRNSKKWQFQFDGANRLTNTITPLGRSTSLVFNHQGLMASLKDPASQTTTYSYDAKGRLTSRADNVGTTIYNYDANDNKTNISENGLTNSWTYDAYNHVSSYKDVYGNLVQYRYDANGNMTNLIYPGGKNVYYAYDSNNHMTGVVDWAGRTTALTYDLAGRLTSVTRPNGTYRTITYDAAGEATNILEQTGIGFPIALFRFNWNSAAEVQWEFAAPLPHTNAPPTRTMTYDDDNRLATFNSASVANDLDGNLTNAPLTNSTFSIYAYDARNRLLNVGGVTNAYDSAGSRIGIAYGTNSESYVINPNSQLPQVLMRIKNGITNYYIYGAGLLYQVTETATATNTLTYHYDYRGSTIALSDGNGNVTDRMEYSAYATLTYHAGISDTPFLFNGRYGVMTDPNGLLYMRARFYNPFLCRFVNSDPSGFSGGLNFYAYANGNPISYLDPFGLSVWTSIAGGLRVVGGGLETVAGYGLATAGAGLSTTGVGAILGVPMIAAGVAVGANGLDQVQAGARQTVSGNQVDSFTSGDLQMLGMSQNTANLTDAGISIVGSLGAGTLTAGVRAAQIAANEPQLVQGMNALQVLNAYDTGAQALNEADYWALGGSFTSPLYKAALIDQGVNVSGDAYQLTTGFGQATFQSGTLIGTGLTPSAAFGAGVIGEWGGVVNEAQSSSGK